MKTDDKKIAKEIEKLLDTLDSELTKTNHNLTNKGRVTVILNFLEEHGYIKK